MAARPRALRGGILASLFVVAVLAPGRLMASEAFPVIGPVDEDKVRKVIAPLDFYAPVEAGFDLAAVDAEQRTITFRMERAVPNGEPLELRVIAYHADDPDLPAEADPQGGFATLVIAGPGVSEADREAVSARLVERLRTHAQGTVALWNREAIDPTEGTSFSKGSGWPDILPPDKLPQDPIVALLNAPNLVYGILALFLLLAVASGLPAPLRRKKG